MARSSYWVTVLACTALGCGCTIAYTEPLFFDCHGTIERYPHYEKLENHKKPQDNRAQLMIDPDGGIVEGPGAIWPAATNEFCSKESDWRERDARQGLVLLIKDIKTCTVLNVSETTYAFHWTMDRLWRTLKNRQPLPENEAQTRGWGGGILNRMTGEYHAETRVWVVSDKERAGEDADGSQIDWDVNDMTCVPAQRKF
jgi:hypothetical protein